MLAKKEQKQNVAIMKQNQKLKELLEKLKKWREGKGEDEELDEIITEFESFDPAGDDEEGSNPPGGPGTPP